MYAVVIQLARWALLLFSRKIITEGITDPGGPLLIVANHPNGFLDGIILATRIERPVWFLGRGDLFRHRLVWAFLKPFHILPLYSAGRNPRLQALNESGLRSCRAVWEKDGVVLIFPEGETEPERGLRPLKKTAFRLADPVWQSPGGNNLKVMAGGIQYDSFNGVGKNILVRMGAPSLPIYQAGRSGQRLPLFQQWIRDKLTACLESGADEPGFLFPDFPGAMRWILFLPGMLGWLLHAPLYLLAKWLVKAAVDRKPFRESWLFLTLFFLYPIYWIGINVSAWVYLASPTVSVILLLMPFWARCYIVRLKRPG